MMAANISTNLKIEIAVEDANIECELDGKDVRDFAKPIASCSDQVSLARRAAVMLAAALSRLTTGGSSHSYGCVSTGRSGSALCRGPIRTLVSTRDTKQTGQYQIAHY
jgi:hypothetical protein